MQLHHLRHNSGGEVFGGASVLLAHLAKAQTSLVSAHDESDVNVCGGTVVAVIRIRHQESATPGQDSVDQRRAASDRARQYQHAKPGWQPWSGLMICTGHG